MFQIEQEGIFARDIDGQLVRVEKATAADYDLDVHLKIDGIPYTVKKAVPERDAQGRILRDAQGQTTPRSTTIYDAVTASFVELVSRAMHRVITDAGSGPTGNGNGTPLHQYLVDNRAEEEFHAKVLQEFVAELIRIRGSDGAHESTRLSGEPVFDDPAAASLYEAFKTKNHPVPTLCHREHMAPVGACRVCMVEVMRERRGRVSSQLVPACHHRVEEGMEIHTIKSSANAKAAQRVRASVTVLVELLLSDHAPDPASEFNELRRLAVNLASLLERDPPPNPQQAKEQAALVERLRSLESRFASRSIDRGHDTSSNLIDVDHNLCILCDRCIRACSDVKRNYVIGRSGKGYPTTIGFDLDNEMQRSSCVSCGECAITCPTDALTFKAGVVEEQVRKLDVPSDGEVLTAEELKRLPLFSGIPFRFLQFNGGAVVRRRLKANDVLCHEGEFGNTAFIIEKGRFEIYLKSSQSHIRKEEQKGLFRRLRIRREKVEKAVRIPTEAGGLADPSERLFRDESDVILGEMACMNSYPRSATVVAVEDSQVLEIRKNVLFMLQRNAASRAVLDRVYRERALTSHLEAVPLFAALPPEERAKCIEELKDRVELIRVEPSQVIFSQGQEADALYVVRLGFVKVSQRVGDDELVLNYLGPGAHFGEIGLLSELSDDLAAGLPQYTGRGTRTATCTALDHVELVRISGEDFKRLVEKEGAQSLRTQLLQSAADRLELDRQRREKIEAASREFLAQGLYGAQNVLLLDLESCTRCDECTKACSETHEGVTRLIREGLRFDRFLVASACRSCMDPVCMVGCPVDAIHRMGDTLQIQIEDHCIGCGLCARNCPYGNINMHGFLERDSRTNEEIQVQHATTCDLCMSLDGQPSCVYACPHEAAHRISGEKLLHIVRGQAP